MGQQDGHKVVGIKEGEVWGAQRGGFCLFGEEIIGGRSVLGVLVDDCELGGLEPVIPFFLRILFSIPLEVQPLNGSGRISEVLLGGGLVPEGVLLEADAAAP